MSRPPAWSGVRDPGSGVRGVFQLSLARSLRGSWLGASLVLAVVIATSAGAQQPYRRMLDDPVSFTGVFRERLAGSAVPIGLFAPEGPAGSVGESMLRGATLAIEEANHNGGFRGLPFRLCRRWAPDPWRGGARELVRMVYEDRVWGIIGGPDSTSTHVAQQIATKTYIPLIAPVSSDPGLTHTRVPWIFRLPPDDSMQARALLDQGARPRSLDRLGIISSTDHDNRVRAQTLVQEMERCQQVPLFQLEAPDDTSLAEIARRSVVFEPDGLILSLPAAPLQSLINELEIAGLGCPIFLPWIPGLRLEELQPFFSGDLIAVDTTGSAQKNPRFRELAAAYNGRWGQEPTPAALYTYDAALLLITAIREAGPEPAGVLGALARGPAATVSGPITWDNGGGNTNPPRLRVLGAVRPAVIPRSP